MQRGSSEPQGAAPMNTAASAVVSTYVLATLTHMRGEVYGPDMRA